jgi:hypothetical protein
MTGNDDTGKTATRPSAAHSQKIFGNPESQKCRFGMKLPES